MPTTRIIAVGTCPNCGHFTSALSEGEDEKYAWIGRWRRFLGQPVTWRGLFGRDPKTIPPRQFVRGKCPLRGVEAYKIPPPPQDTGRLL